MSSRLIPRKTSTYGVFHFQNGYEPSQAVGTPWELASEVPVHQHMHVSIDRGNVSLGLPEALQ